MALIEKTSHKWIIAIVAILVIAGIVFAIYKLSQPSEDTPVIPPVDETHTNPGIGDTIKNGFCTLFPKSKLCGGPGKDKPVNCVDNCDTNKYGYDCYGFLNPNCGAG